MLLLVNEQRELLSAQRLSAKTMCGAATGAGSQQQSLSWSLKLQVVFVSNVFPTIPTDNKAPGKSCSSSKYYSSTLM